MPRQSLRGPRWSRGDRGYHVALRPSVTGHVCAPEPLHGGPEAVVEGDGDHVAEQGPEQGVVGLAVTDVAGPVRPVVDLEVVAQHRLSRHEFDGETREELTWPTSDGATSEAPAARHLDDTARTGLDLGPLLQGTWEVLELPGEVLDYHFALQSTVGILWSKHRRAVTALRALEVLARLDIALLAAQPLAFLPEGAVDGRYYRVTTFGPLLTILEREGAWRDALEVVEAAVRVGQLESRRDVIADRVAALEAETP